jgi:hypothetical protein
MAHLRLQAASSLLESSENKWLKALLEYFKGLLAFYEGDAKKAAVLLEETTALAREGQYKPDLARSLVTLGSARLALGEVELAARLVLQGLALYQEVGNKQGVAIALEQLAAVSAVQRDGLQAVTLFCSADALRETISAPLPPVDRATYDFAIAASRAQLGEAAFAAAWEHASARPYQEVVEEILKSNKYTVT